MKLVRMIVAAMLLTSPVMLAQPKKGETKPAPKTAQAKGDQCQAKTKDGDQCKRKAAAGSKFCWQHGGKKK